jgi:hypothetical protein
LRINCITTASGRFNTIAGKTIFSIECGCPLKIIYLHINFLSCLDVYIFAEQIKEPCKQDCTEKKGILIPSVLIRAITRSIQLSLCKAEMIPKIIPKTMAIIIAKRANMAVFGNVLTIISDTFCHFSEAFPQMGVLITRLVSNIK